MLIKLCKKQVVIHISWIKFKRSILYLAKTYALKVIPLSLMEIKVKQVKLQTVHPLFKRRILKKKTTPIV